MSLCNIMSCLSILEVQAKVEFGMTRRGINNFIKEGVCSIFKGGKKDCRRASATLPPSPLK